MPIFEFECRKCGSRFSRILQNLKAADDVDCIHCHAKDVQRLVSNFNAKASGSQAAGKSCGHSGMT